MKRIAFTLFTLHFSLFTSLFASPFAPDTAIEVVVYSKASSSPLRVSTFHASPFDAVISRTFPASYTGHRAVCQIPRATTNDDFFAWIGGPTFSPGDFFGCSNLRSARQIELSRTSPIFARLDLYAGTDDRVALYGDGTFDISGEIATQGLVSNVVWRTARPGIREHVRVVPYMVTGNKKTDEHGNEQFVLLGGLVLPRVVAEFDISPDEKPTLTEADILRDGEFDIDWSAMKSEIIGNVRVIDAVGDATAIRFRLVFGYEGLISDADADQAGLNVEAFKYLVERRFEPSAIRTTPTGLHTSAGAGASRPTFRWRLDEPVSYGVHPSVAQLGCSYTAFQIQVTNVTTHAFFDSGVLRAPARDSSREFAWTPSDEIAPATGDWKWRVAMYNAKLKPSTRSNGWSEWQEFSMSVGTQNE